MKPSQAIVHIFEWKKQRLYKEEEMDHSQKIRELVKLNIAPVCK